MLPYLETPSESRAMSTNGNSKQPQQAQGAYDFRPERGNFLFRNKRPEFTVQSLSDFRSEQSLPIYPHRRMATQVFLLTEGFSTHTCGIDTYELQPQSLLVIPQSYLSSLERMEPATKGFYCSFNFALFSGPQEEELKQDFAFLFTDTQAHINLNAPGAEDLTLLFNRLIREEDLKDEPDLSLIRSYLMTLLHEIKQVLPKEPNKNLSRNHVITREFKELLQASQEQWYSVKEYADQLRISSNHLNKAVKTATGKSAKQVITDALILEAKYLLHLTNFSVISISYELRMEDPAYFSRMFKKQTGHSPVEYRKMIEKSS